MNVYFDEETESLPRAPPPSNIYSPGPDLETVCRKSIHEQRRQSRDVFEELGDVYVAPEDFNSE